MSKSFSKRMLKIKSNIDFNKKYEIDQAIELIKKNKSNKFTESIDVAINLNIDAKKSDQNIRGSVVLPYGTGRNIKVAVFVKDVQKIEEAKKAGAELVGADDLAEIIKKGEINFKTVIASPDTMNIVSKLGQILGPKGLMPNPKTGTITDDIYTAVKNAKSGQIKYRNDKNGIIHSIIGLINFENKKIIKNLECLLNNLKKNKPKNTKGIFFKKIVLSSTMGVGISIDINSLSITL